MMNFREKIKNEIRESEHEEYLKEKIDKYVQDIKFQAANDARILVEKIDLKVDSRYSENEIELMKIKEMIKENKKFGEELKEKKEKILEKIKEENEKKSIEERKRMLLEFNPVTHKKIYKFEKSRSSYLSLKRAERKQKHLLYVKTEDHLDTDKVIGEFYKDQVKSIREDFPGTNDQIAFHIKEYGKKPVVRIPEVNRYDIKDPNFEKIYKNMNMEIHMMCHSHMDLGWLLKVKELQNWGKIKF